MMKVSGMKNKPKLKLRDTTMKEKRMERIKKAKIRVQKKNKKMLKKL